MKILILRFSSFGDILQTLSVAGRLHEVFPESEIHWATRADFRPLIEGHPAIKQLWLIRKGQGFWELWALARQLRQEKFTHIYDAHNNLRSRLICAYLNGFLGWRRLQHAFLRRSIFRFKRFLLFRFRYNLFLQPFSGQRDLLLPLEKWGVPFQLPAVPQLFIDRHVQQKVGPKTEKIGRYIGLAPSAAFELKRWPLEYWKRLTQLLPQYKFIVLGGKEDKFLSQLESENVSNWAGALNFMESAAVIENSTLLISNDTSLLHVAEQLGKPCIALMGPAPFGFPSRSATKILELSLNCRPCSKHGQGPCKNAEYHKCLRGILPEQVAETVKSMVHA